MSSEYDFLKNVCPRNLINFDCLESEKKFPSAVMFVHLPVVFPIVLIVDKYYYHYTEKDRQNWERKDFFSSILSKYYFSIPEIDSIEFNSSFIIFVRGCQIISSPKCDYYYCTSQIGGIEINSPKSIILPEKNFIIIFISGCARGLFSKMIKNHYFRTKGLKIVAGNNY